MTTWILATLAAVVVFLYGLHLVKQEKKRKHS